MADDDVESQRSSGDSQSSKGLPYVEVGVTLTPVKAAAWEKKFGQRPFVERPGKYHSHGMVAAQRFVAEAEACRLALEDPEVTVMDVGAAPHRTWRRLGERGWYVMPHVLPGDNARIARAPPAARDRICHCRIEVCQCVEGPVALLCVHSGYYVDPVQFWRLLNDERVRDCIVVEHPFTDVAGGFYDEAEWYFDGKLIRMSVKGQEQAPYVHPLPPWASGWRGVGGEAFHADVLEDWDGVTRIIRVTTYVDQAPASEKLVWERVTAEDNLAGPVQFSTSTRASNADNAKLGRITFDFDRVYKAGPFLYTTSFFGGETVQAIVPVNGVARAAAHVANRPRTPELYQELTYIVRQFYTRGRLPACVQGQTIAAVVALGFVVNIGIEMDLVHTVVERFTWRMKAHSTLLGFGRLAVKRWYWLFGALCAIIGVTSLVDIFDDHNEVDVYFTLTAVLFIALGFCCVCTVLPAHRDFQRWMERSWTANLSDPEGPAAPLLGQNFTFTRNLPIPGSRYVRAPADDLCGSLLIGATRESVVPRTGTMVSGIVIDGLMPTALDVTQEAEVSAVTNRILLRRENPEPGALLELTESFDDASMLPPGEVDSTVVGLKAWLSAIRKRFPVVYVQQMEKLWYQYQGTVASPSSTKSFIKVEKSASTVKLDGGKRVKPRLIQPPSDESKAVLGPLISQLQHRYATFWNGLDNSIMYCSGYTNSQVGGRVDAFIASCGGEGNVVAWSMDMEVYDASLSFPVQLLAFRQYLRAGLPKWATSWLLSTRPRGQTPNGVVYSPTRIWVFEGHQEDMARELHRLHEKYDFKSKLTFSEETDEWCVEAEDFQMVSGRPDTNLTDSVVLAHTASAAARRREIPYLLLVCGDDGFLMVHVEHEDVFEETKSFSRRLGLKPTGTVSTARKDWEFCSRLFFFGVHPGSGEEQTVLGAKPFRGIARMGVNTTLPGAQNAAAAALSVRQDAGHVPFLAPLADRTYELCRDQRLRPVGRPEWSAFSADAVRWVCSPKNYILTQERYGLGVEAENEFKRLLGDLSRVPCVLSWMPAVDAAKVDEA